MANTKKMINSRGGNSRAGGCAIPEASNYDPSAVGIGCPPGDLPNGRGGYISYSVGTLFCCEFDCESGRFSDKTRKTEYEYVPDEEDCATPDGEPLSSVEIQKRRDYIRKRRNQRDTETHYSIPLAFHDIYGSDIIQNTDNVSWCDNYNCECIAYKATQVLSEQYLDGNITYYRACQDADGTILSETECNRGDGELLEVVDTPDEFIHGRNNTNSNNHTTGGWNDFEYFDNVINVYITQCITNPYESDIAITICDPGLNGFAQRGSYGDNKHRGTAMTHTSLFADNMSNWSTFGHELGHTFNGNHLFSNNSGFVDNSNCSTYGDRICDTEPNPTKHKLSNSSYWNTDSFIVNEDYGDGFGSNSHTYCVFRGYDGEYSTDTDTLSLADWNSIESSFGNYVRDDNGDLYGTRDLDWAWDENAQAYIVTGLLQRLKDHHMCGYTDTCNSEEYHGTNAHNLLVTASITPCRNLGCYYTSGGKCTPLPAYTYEQFSAWRYDIEEGNQSNYFGLIGCTQKGDANWAPNWVINDPEQCTGSCEDDGLVTCWDGSCASTEVECPETCEEQGLYSCTDGSCADTCLDCLNATCGDCGFVTCWDGSCAATEGYCPNYYTFTYCHEDIECDSPTLSTDIFVDAGADIFTGMSIGGSTLNTLKYTLVAACTTLGYVGVATDVSNGIGYINQSNWLYNDENILFDSINTGQSPYTNTSYAYATTYGWSSYATSNNADDACIESGSSYVNGILSGNEVHSGTCRHHITSVTCIGVESDPEDPETPTLPDNISFKVYRCVDGIDCNEKEIVTTNITDFYYDFTDLIPGEANCFVLKTVEQSGIEDSRTTQESEFSEVSCITPPLPDLPEECLDCNPSYFQYFEHFDFNDDGVVNTTLDFTWWAGNCSNTGHPECVDMNQWLANIITVCSMDIYCGGPVTYNTSCATTENVTEDCCCPDCADPGYSSTCNNYPIFGCMQEEAINYNPDATSPTDCFYGCCGVGITNNELNAPQCIWLTSAGICNGIGNGGVCDCPGSIQCSDLNGYFQDGYDNTYICTGTGCTATWTTYSEGSYTELTNYYGCTDSNATNYSADALCDDNSCEYLSGCTNSLATNYFCLENGTIVCTSHWDCGETNTYCTEASENGEIQVPYIEESACEFPPDTITIENITLESNAIELTLEWDIEINDYGDVNDFSSATVGLQITHGSIEADYYDSGGVVVNEHITENHGSLTISIAAGLVNDDFLWLSEDYNYTSLNDSILYPGSWTFNFSLTYDGSTFPFSESFILLWYGCTISNIDGVNVPPACDNEALCEDDGSCPCTYDSEGVDGFDSAPIQYTEALLATGIYGDCLSNLASCYTHTETEYFSCDAPQSEVARFCAPGESCFRYSLISDMSEIEYYNKVCTSHEYDCIDNGYCAYYGCVNLEALNYDACAVTDPAGACIGYYKVDLEPGTYTLVFTDNTIDTVHISEIFQELPESWGTGTISFFNTNGQWYNVLAGTNYELFPDDDCDMGGTVGTCSGDQDFCNEIPSSGTCVSLGCTWTSGENDPTMYCQNFYNFGVGTNLSFITNYPFRIWNCNGEDPCSGSNLIELDVEAGEETEGPVFGCMDSEACNYNVEANAYDGNCTYPVIFCYDGDGDNRGETENCGLGNNTTDCQQDACPGTLDYPWVQNCDDIDPACSCEANNETCFDCAGACIPSDCTNVSDFGCASTDDAGCGCINGNTGLSSGWCWGCLDETALNYLECVGGDCDLDCGGATWVNVENSDTSCCEYAEALTNMGLMVAQSNGHYDHNQMGGNEYYHNAFFGQEQFNYIWYKLGGKVELDGNVVVKNLNSKPMNFSLWTQNYDINQLWFHEIDNIDNYGFSTSYDIGLIPPKCDYLVDMIMINSITLGGQPSSDSIVQTFQSAGICDEDGTSDPSNCPDDAQEVIQVFTDPDYIHYITYDEIQTWVNNNKVYKYDVNDDNLINLIDSQAFVNYYNQNTDCGDNYGYRYRRYLNGFEFKIEVCDDVTCNNIGETFCIDGEGKTYNCETGEIEAHTVEELSDGGHLQLPDSDMGVCLTSLPGNGYNHYYSDCPQVNDPYIITDEISSSGFACLNGNGYYIDISTGEYMDPSSCTSEGEIIGNCKCVNTLKWHDFYAEGTVGTGHMAPHLGWFAGLDNSDGTKSWPIVPHNYYDYFTYTKAFTEDFGSPTKLKGVLPDHSDLYWPVNVAEELGMLENNSFLMTGMLTYHPSLTQESALSTSTIKVTMTSPGSITSITKNIKFESIKPELICNEYWQSGNYSEGVDISVGNICDVVLIGYMNTDIEGCGEDYSGECIGSYIQGAGGGPNLDQDGNQIIPTYHFEMFEDQGSQLDLHCKLHELRTSLVCVSVNGDVVNDQNCTIENEPCGSDGSCVGIDTDRYVYNPYTPSNFQSFEIEPVYNDEDCNGNNYPCLDGDGHIKTEHGKLLNWDQLQNLNSSRHGDTPPRPSSGGGSRQVAPCECNVELDKMKELENEITTCDQEYSNSDPGTYVCRPTGWAGTTCADGLQSNFNYNAFFERSLGLTEKLYDSDNSPGVSASPGNANFDGEGIDGDEYEMFYNIGPATYHYSSGGLYDPPPEDGYLDIRFFNQITFNDGYCGPRDTEPTLLGFGCKDNQPGVFYAPDVVSQAGYWPSWVDDLTNTNNSCTGENENYGNDDCYIQSGTGFTDVMGFEVYSTTWAYRRYNQHDIKTDKSLWLPIQGEWNPEYWSSDTPMYAHPHTTCGEWIIGDEYDFYPGTSSVTDTNDPIEQITIDNDVFHNLAENGYLTKNNGFNGWAGYAEDNDQNENTMDDTYKGGAPCLTMNFNPIASHACGDPDKPGNIVKNTYSKIPTNIDSEGCHSGKYGKNCCCVYEWEVGCIDERACDCEKCPNHECCNTQLQNLAGESLNYETVFGGFDCSDIENESNPTSAQMDKACFDQAVNNGSDPNRLFWNQTLWDDEYDGIKNAWPSQVWYKWAFSAIDSEYVPHPELDGYNYDTKGFPIWGCYLQKNPDGFEKYRCQNKECHDKGFFNPYVHGLNSDSNVRRFLYDNYWVTSGRSCNYSSCDGSSTRNGGWYYISDIDFNGTENIRMKAKNSSDLNYPECDIETGMQFFCDTYSYAECPYMCDNTSGISCQYPENFSEENPPGFPCNHTGGQNWYEFDVSITIRPTNDNPTITNTQICDGNIQNNECAGGEWRDSGGRDNDTGKYVTKLHFDTNPNGLNQTEKIIKINISDLDDNHQILLPNGAVYQEGYILNDIGSAFQGTRVVGDDIYVNVNENWYGIHTFNYLVKDSGGGPSNTCWVGEEVINGSPFKSQNVSLNDIKNYSDVIYDECWDQLTDDRYHADCTDEISNLELNLCPGMRNDDNMLACMCCKVNESISISVDNAGDGVTWNPVQYYLDVYVEEQSVESAFMNQNDIDGTMTYNCQINEDASNSYSIVTGLRTVGATPKYDYGVIKIYGNLQKECGSSDTPCYKYYNEYGAEFDDCNTGNCDFVHDGVDLIVNSYIEGLDFTSHAPHGVIQMNGMHNLFGLFTDEFNISYGIWDEGEYGYGIREYEPGKDMYKISKINLENGSVITDCSDCQDWTDYTDGNGVTKIFTESGEYIYYARRKDIYGNYNDIEFTIEVDNVVTIFPSVNGLYLPYQALDIDTSYETSTPSYIVEEGFECQGTLVDGCITLGVDENSCLDLSQFGCQYFETENYNICVGDLSCVSLYQADFGCPSGCQIYQVGVGITDSFENTSEWFESHDRDKRKSLGLYYFNDYQQEKNWAEVLANNPNSFKSSDITYLEPWSPSNELEVLSFDNTNGPEYGDEFGYFEVKDNKYRVLKTMWQWGTNTNLDSWLEFNNLNLETIHEIEPWIDMSSFETDNSGLFTNLITSFTVELNDDALGDCLVPNMLELTNGYSLDTAGQTGNNSGGFKITITDSVATAEPRTGVTINGKGPDDVDDWVENCGAWKSGLNYVEINMKEGTNWSAYDFGFDDFFNTTDPEKGYDIRRIEIYRTGGKGIGNPIICDYELGCQSPVDSPACDGVFDGYAALPFVSDSAWYNTLGDCEENEGVCSESDVNGCTVDGGYSCNTFYDTYQSNDFIWNQGNCYDTIGGLETQCEQYQLTGVDEVIDGPGAYITWASHCVDGNCVSDSTGISTGYILDCDNNLVLKNMVTGVLRYQNMCYNGCVEGEDASGDPATTVNNLNVNLNCPAFNYSFGHCGGINLSDFSYDDITDILNQLQVSWDCSDSNYFWNYPSYFAPILQSEFLENMGNFLTSIYSIDVPDTPADCSDESIKTDCTTGHPAVFPYDDAESNPKFSYCEWSPLTCQECPWDGVVLPTNDQGYYTAKIGIYNIKFHRNFVPDVDARSTNSFRNNLDVPVIHYYDKTIDYGQGIGVEYDVNTAPLEVQFYFYPRETGEVYEDKQILYNSIPKFGVAFIDWGDGTDTEFTDEPKSIGRVITHNYEKSGIYEITGYMFPYDKSGEKIVVGKFKKFILRIKLNKKVGFENEFKVLGGDDYIFIPKDYRTPIIGGVSNQSLYWKTLEIENGYIPGRGNIPVRGLEFKYYRDLLESQDALMQLDENKIGPDIIHYTTSYVDRDDSNKEIYSGEYKNPGELGDHVGNMDVGQLRYFTTGSHHMWKMLGGGVETAHSGSIRYWKNISDNTDVLEILQDDSYYPVLPDLNLAGEFTNQIPVGEIPFGSDRNWNSDDTTAYITKSEIKDNSLLIDLNFQMINEDSLGDLSGNNNLGCIITDYRIDYDRETREPYEIKFKAKSKIGRKDKQY
jgi:hypothetical protein